MNWSTVTPITVTMIVAGLTLVITARMELTRYELAIALTAIPCSSGLLVMWSFGIREWFSRKHRLPSDAPANMTEAQLETIWGTSLSKLDTVISLGEERIKLAQSELQESLRGSSTNVYALVRIGYKCIQTSKAARLLCVKGFPDQALVVSRRVV